MRRLGEFIINILATIVLLIGLETPTSTTTFIIFMISYFLMRSIFQSLGAAFDKNVITISKKLNIFFTFLSYISFICLLFVPIFIGINIAFSIVIGFVAILTNCFNSLLDSVDIPYYL